MPDMKKQRGQFFTKNATVHAVMGNLVSSHTGRVLEPSAGAGDLVNLMENRYEDTFEIDAVELDDTLLHTCRTPVTHEDFFTYARTLDESYDVIIGNPPYVAWKGLEKATMVSAASIKARYTDKTNLYHLFIDRCIDLLKPQGELVFIVPKEWLFTSSAQPLREKIMKEGALTHLVDCGEEKLFDDADVPALLIFRFVKGADSSTGTMFAASLTAAYQGTWDQRYLYNRNGRLLLLSKTLGDTISEWGVLRDSYRVRVGIVTGADKVFKVSHGLVVEPSCVKEYLTTKGLEKFIDVGHVKEWKDMPPLTAAYLLQHKEQLITRGIADFDETNWWKYGAVRNKEAMLSKRARFYGIVKTRSNTPFFMSPNAVLFGGGILGMFSTEETDVTIPTAVKVLNSPAYWEIFEAMFLTTGDKVSLQPATLEDAPFPRTEADAVKWLSALVSSTI